MERVLFLALLAVILFSLPVYAADTLAFTAEVTIPNASFVYKGSSEDLVIPSSEMANLGTTYSDSKLGYGSIGGHIAAAAFLADAKAIVLISGSSVDTLKIISMPTTPKDATVVYSVSLGVKTTHADLVKLSNTKFMIVYKVEDDTDTLFANVITVDSGMTTLTLGTADSTTVDATIRPVIARISATAGVIYYNYNDSNLLSKTFSTATGTLEVASTTIKSGTVEAIVNDHYNNIAFSKAAGASPELKLMTDNGATMTLASTIATALADTVEIGDVCKLDTTYSVLIYKLGTTIYAKAVNTSTEAFGAATIISTKTIGDNFNVNKMIVKLNPTHFIVSVGGVIKSYTLNTSTLALTLFGTDAFEADDTYNPALYTVYSDTVTTNPAIFKTHWDRPNSHLRKISYINYATAPRIGFVATGVATGAPCTVTLNGIVTKTATAVDSGSNAYVDNSGTLVADPAGCADPEPVGIKLRGTNLLLK